MKTHEAYARLGLRPLDDYLGGSSGDRRMGATTWMLVEAAVAVLDGEDILLMGHNLQDAETLADECRRYVFELLGPASRVAVRPASRKRMTQIQGYGAIYWESDRTLKMFLRGRPDPPRVFRDSDYRHMAISRREGPFAEIRELVWKGDGYEAYDARGELLMELTEEGGKQLLDADPYRISVTR